LLVGIGMNMTAGAVAGNDLYIVLLILAGFFSVWTGGVAILMRKKENETTDRNQ